MMLGKRIALCLAVSSLVVLGLVHCSSDPPAVAPETTNDAGNNNNNNNNNNNPPGDSGGPVTDGGDNNPNNPNNPAPGECGLTKLCLDLGPDLDPITKDYRLTVLWAQLNDDGPDPVPEVAYDAVILATTKRIEIPLTAVKAPTDEKNLLCDRATTDEAVSPCLSDPKVGYGILIAYEDTNGDGKYVRNDDKQIGSANAIFGFSAKFYAPNAMPSTPYQWNGLWPTGIGEGVKIYQVGRPDGGGFDRPLQSAAGTTNLLQKRSPNLS
jgi:hypothetical protein